MRQQLGECFVLCQCLLYLSVRFPTGIARSDKILPGPHTGVKPGKPKKFSTVLFEDCLRLLGGLDHFLRLVAFEARKLYNSHDLFPPWGPHGLGLGMAAEVHRDPPSDVRLLSVRLDGKSRRMRINGRASILDEPRPRRGISVRNGCCGWNAKSTRTVRATVGLC